MNFFDNLKKIFYKIPVKSRFLKDLGFSSYYSGFRYFMQERANRPSKILMEVLCDNMGYEYIIMPIRKTEDEQEKKEELFQFFFDDLEEYLKKYERDVSRIYTKDFGDESSIASAVEAFTKDELKDEKIDVSDLF